MRPGRMISSEDLQLIVLKLLSDAPRHGYEIIKAIGELSSGMYSPSPGMVYPVLTYLEELSYATSVLEGTKKRFTITEEGGQFLGEQDERVKKLLNDLKLHGQRMAFVQSEIAQEEAAEHGWGGGPTGRGSKEWRQLRSDFQELRSELKSALFEKLHAPLEEKQRVMGVLRKAISEIRSQPGRS